MVPDIWMEMERSKYHAQSIRRGHRSSGGIGDTKHSKALGIGSTSLLTKLGIEVRVKPPGVGEKLQDQPDLTFSYSPKTATPRVLTPYAAAVTANGVFGDKTEEIAADVSHGLIDTLNKRSTSPFIYSNGVQGASVS